MCARVWETATEGIERERWADGQGEGTADPECIVSLSLSMSYVIHMIHVEPRGAGITLTFCVQHTHTHTLPTNTKEMCPQIPSPRALCTVVVHTCVQTYISVCVLWLFVDIQHTVCILKTDPVSTMFVTVGALRRDKCAPKNSLPVPMMHLHL